MATDGTEESPPSFFKVVRFPSAPHLVLPIEFVKRHLEKIPKNAILKAAIGGNSWRLKVKKIGEDYCFSNGWEKLAKDVQFHSMDLFVAFLIDPFTFEVRFFDADGCEKNLQLSEGNEEEVDEVIADGEGGGDDDDDDGDEVIASENLCFQMVFSEKSHKDTMGLPKKFVEAAELENKRSVQMKDHEGKEWIMGLMAEKFNRRSLSSGWSLFREYYEISDGDILLFKFIKEEGVLSLAQVLKNNRARKQENKRNSGGNVEGVKRKRGRPFKRKRGRPRLEKPLNGGGVKVKIENELGPQEEVVKRKRGRPRLQKHHGGGGDVDVKIEDQSSPAVEVVKRKRGRPRVEKRGGDDGRGSGGGVRVKVEDGWGAEVEVVKRKRGRPRVEKGGGGGSGGGGSSGGVKVKIEDGDGSVVERKRERPPAVVEKGGGVEVKREVEEEVEEVAVAEEVEEVAVAVKRIRETPRVEK
ncbi:hypothetical protein OSB04_021655, partial [Centaurea solstitialis]